MSLTPNAALPFKDQQFDIAYSNAVFEHLESDELREFFFSELSRVAKQVYICVPNRWFPLEHHTAIPLIHYIPTLFRYLLRNGEKSFWAEPKNLDFISKSKLKGFADGSKVNACYTGIWLGPFSSNIAVWSD